MKNIILGILIVIGLGVMGFLVTRNISTVNDNNKNIFSTYFKIKEMLDVFGDRIPNCTELNVILNKDLKDNKIKQYELWELKYYFNKDKKCINNINSFMKKPNLKNITYNKHIMDKIKANNKIKKELIKKGYY